MGNTVRTFKYATTQRILQHKHRRLCSPFAPLYIKIADLYYDQDHKMTVIITYIRH